MPKLAANVSTMYQELPLPERFAAAGRCGFQAVEYLHPYDYSTADLADWLAAAGLKLILLNIDPGDKGEAGTAAMPGREAHFKASFEQALEYAQSLGAPMIHVMAGRQRDGISPSTTHFVENIRWASDLAGQSVTINLEPLNDRDVAGYLHTRRAETLRLIELIDRPNVGLQFDFYHQQIMDGDLARGLSDYQHVISHVQLSSLPGRHEPQYGEVNAHYLLSLLDTIGYDGWVGCEYWPRDDTWQGLSWAARYGITGER